MGMNLWIYDDRTQRARWAAITWFASTALVYFASFGFAGGSADLAIFITGPLVGALVIYLAHGKTTIDVRGVLIEEGFRRTRFVPLEHVRGFVAGESGLPTIWLSQTDGSSIRVGSVAPSSVLGRRVKFPARIEELNRILAQARALV